MHAILAATLQAPELVLTDDEGKRFATTLDALSHHYNVHISQSAMDHTNFFLMLGSLYGPRLAAIGLRKRSERSQKPQAPRANIDNVFPFAQRKTVNEPRPAPVNNQPGQTVSIDPEGDPTSAPGSQRNDRPMTDAERLFAQTPPDLI